MISKNHFVLWMLSDMVNRVVSVQLLQLLALQMDASRLWRLIRALSHLATSVAISSLDKLYLLILCGLVLFALNLDTLLVRRNSNLISNHLPLVLFELAGLSALLSCTVINVVRF
jgi:hypothetical protein